MIKWRRVYRGVLLTAFLFGFGSQVGAAAEPEAYVITGESFLSRNVEAQIKPDQPWRDYHTRILGDVPEDALRSGYAGSRYGGWLERRTDGTGYFRAEKIDGRWWLIDPDGYYYLHKGVVSVRPGTSANARSSFQARFRSERAWAEETTGLLRSFGFNGTGAWSSVQSLRAVDEPLVYTQMWNFMSQYGQLRGGTYRKPGHTGYPNDAIFVFDPEFETFAFEYARNLESTKDDPYLLGHFSDNELPFTRDGLDKFLRLPPDDPGYIAAYEWLRERQGLAEPDLSRITERDRLEWNGYVADRYLSIVSRAIKSVDPNHMYLGPRFHGSALSNPYIFEAAGKHLDAIGINLYSRWVPRLPELAEWEQRSGKPIIITEWYTKGEDSGLPNYSGAGWVVRTQADRGAFYQNFVLALLESRAVVGWHWFRYQDNDPADPVAEPSNEDANKGIVRIDYEPYCELLYPMRALNLLAYPLVKYIDEGPVAVPRGGDSEYEFGGVLPPESFCERPSGFDIVSPREGEAVHGLVALRLKPETSSDDSSAVEDVRFYIDDRPVELVRSGAEEWLLDTTSFDDGIYTLQVVRGNPGEPGSVRRFVAFRIENRWTIDDRFEPPVIAGWFGTVRRDKTMAESDGWQHATDNALFGYSSRKVRSSDTDQFLVWETPNLEAFTLVVLATAPALPEPIVIETSSDGELWRSVAFATALDDRRDGDWFRIEISGSLPEAEKGVRYIRVTVPRQGLPADAVQLAHALFEGRVIDPERQ